MYEKNGSAILKVFFLNIFLTVIIIFHSVGGYAREPLPVEDAFKISIHLVSKDQILITWNIAEDYYLYQERVGIKVMPASRITFKMPSLPKGHKKYDKIRGNYEVYLGTLSLPIHLNQVSRQWLALEISYQGCSAKGFCYIPLKKYLTVNIAEIHNYPYDLTPLIQNVIAKNVTVFSSDQYAEKIFYNHNLPLIILSFLGLGLLLSFTPCVLPMLPVLSGIILGQRRALNSVKTFSLSLAYVLGMAVTYMFAGIAVASLGSQVQIFLQTPIVIFLFSSVFVLLALSLFGIYHLQLPAYFQQKLTVLSNQQKKGTYLGVFCMGGISSLIVSPCVSPPLVGVLAYIAETGNVWMGGLALLALGFGMGIPLLLFGTSAARLLPKAGGWMIIIERVMGLCMLAFAIFMLSRIIPGYVTLLLWSLFFMGVAIFLSFFAKALSSKTFLARAGGALLFVYAFILLIGAFFGNESVIHPLENVLSSAGNLTPTYVNIQNTTQLYSALRLAKGEHKPVMLDFYADWCVSCIKMERNVFKNEMVQAALSHFSLLRVDLTHNNTFDRQIMAKYKVIAPPTFLFFNEKGQELTSLRIIGERNTTAFLSHLSKIKEFSRAN